jgi:4'-phosphopantetheinyl transferase
VWFIDLNPPLRRLNELQSLLSSDERQRAERLHFPDHRRRSTVASATRRLLLAPYLKMPPEEIPFSLGPHGKPFIADSNWHFNLSHSNDLALMAICEGFEVGIDIEYWRSRINIDGLVNRVCSAREEQEFLQLPSSQHIASFYKVWTCKEAFVKAIGKGMLYGLSDIEVEVNPAKPARLIKAIVSDINLDQFFIRSLDVPVDYSAHLVVNTRTKADSLLLHLTYRYC